MNAQQLLNETPTEPQSFGDFSKFFKSPSKQINDDRGDKSFARMQSKTAQVGRKGFFTSFQKNIVLSDTHDHSLKRTTDILQQININNCKNTATFKGDVIRSIGIEGL